MASRISAWPEAPPFVMPARRSARPNGLIVLDQAWARRLGVQRVGGVYRIRRRELVERLAQLQREQTDRSVRPSWLLELAAGRGSGHSDRRVRPAPGPHGQRRPEAGDRCSELAPPELVDARPA